MNYGDIARRFIMNEGAEDLGISSRIQAITDLLSNINAKSATDERRLEMVFEHLKQLRRLCRKLSSQETTTDNPEE